ncbi:MAG: MFS transporter [Anaerolineaceae bacterium]|nr:MFS transporter [Anaerolineaceae bacterium]
MMKRVGRFLFPYGAGNVTRLTLIYFFSTLYFYVPVGTLYLQSKGLNYLMVNSIWGIIVGTMFLAEIPTGMIADRVGRKNAVILALGLQLCGEIIYLFSNAYWLFVVCAVIGGLGFAFSSGCIEALVIEELNRMGRGGEINRGMGLIQAGTQSANLVAFLLGGWLLREVSQERFTLAIALTAACVGLGFLLTFTLREGREARRTEGEQHDESSLTYLRDGWRLLRRNTAFRWLIALAIFTIPFRDYLINLYQPRFIEAGLPPFWLGLALALASGVGILCARYAYLLETRLGSRAALIFSTFLPGALYLSFALVTRGAGLIPLFCVLLGAQSLKSPLLSAHLNAHIPDHNRATVLSMISMASGAYVMLMGLLIGWVADQSLSGAFLLMGGVICLGAVFFGRSEPARE